MFSFWLFFFLDPTASPKCASFITELEYHRAQWKFIKDRATSFTSLEPSPKSSPVWILNGSSPESGKDLKFLRAHFPEDKVTVTNFNLSLQIETKKRPASEELEGSKDKKENMENMNLR